MFICFQKSPQQFIDIQNHLGHQDKLNEYITHRGSATFLVLPGVKKEATLVKRYLIKVVILLAILTMAFRIAPMPSAAADKPSISDVYVSITDAKSILEDKSKSDKDKKQAIKDIENS